MPESRYTGIPLYRNTENNNQNNDKNQNIMTIHQLSIFIENRSGTLIKVLEVLKEALK